MRWEKLGCLYSVENVHPKLVSHAANPLAIPLQGDSYRVFYSARDNRNRSSVSFVDIDLVKRKVVYQHTKPVFEHGPPGTFYADGVSVGCHYQVGPQRYILFMGWQHEDRDHWRGDIGRLRVSDDLNTLTLDCDEPFMGADKCDPISLSYPWVLQDGTHFRMWYGSTLNWDYGNGEMLHVINTAESSDGHVWNRQGLALPYMRDVAQAFSRPCLIRDQEGCHMWFSYRSGKPNETYRIGYAHSRDGLAWELKLEDVGMDVSEAGWDSEMIEYPYVFDHHGQRYMLYNGNQYGKTGLGLAVLHGK